MSITPLSPFTTLPSDAEGPIETGSCAVDPVPGRIGFVAPFLMAIAVVALSGCGSDDQSLANRQQAVAEAGADVMPFTLDATTHVFVDTSTGGIQDVAADDPSDTTNID